MWKKKRTKKKNEDELKNVLSVVDMTLEVSVVPTPIYLINICINDLKYVYREISHIIDG